ncbi:MAG: CRTAC1 family protein [Verrucomicrobia bacterium]|nr:CRTAC1 family protein [Verrucomicrobiota bacterium]
MSKRASIIVVCLLLLAALGFWFFQSARLSEKRLSQDSVFDSNTPSAAPAVDEPLADGLRKIEARRLHLDQTVWADELTAQRHEAVFIKLWDDLRSAEDAGVVLTNFAFGELRLGTLGPADPREHGIAVQRLGDPIQRLEPHKWREWVASLKQQGWRLEQSEWRHKRFAVNSQGVSESLIFMTLHAARSNASQRCVARGNLRVEWRKSRKTGGEPFPELIDVTQLEVLSRTRQLPFHHVVAADLTPEKAEPSSLEPSLQLYDLDGDGLSEIIVAPRNRIFWNRGQGVFTPDRFLSFPLPAMNAFLLADFDADGLADLLAADPQGLALFAGDEKGRFLKPPKRLRFTAQELANPIVMTAGDIDRDGDLDVWLAQYKVPYQSGQVPTPYYDANDGWPSFLLVNDGRGNFADRTAQAGLAAKRFRRTYSSSLVDLDDDRDLDLVVVSDFAGTDVYFNDGNGNFTEATSRVLDEARAFGMAHTFGDFDRDGHLDFFVIGMNSFVADRLDALQAGAPEFPEHARMRPKMAQGNRLYFWRDGVFQQTHLSGLVARSGWSWGGTSGDFDNDGDLDLYVANGHISGRSARDYEPEFWQHDIYLGGSKNDPALERYFQSVRMRYQGAGLSYGGFEKNRLYLNEAGKSFLEAAHLLGVSLEEDCRNVVSDDLDGDGKLDLLVVAFQTWPEIRQALHIFPNFTEKPGHWIGFRLRESGSGFSPVGAKVILTTASGAQVRHLVTGDSYRSQHANTAHFGLGADSAVRSVEVVWPAGEKTKIDSPAINRYHEIKAPASRMGRLSK